MCRAVPEETANRIAQASRTSVIPRGQMFDDVGAMQLPWENVGWQYPNPSAATGTTCDRDCRLLSRRDDLSLPVYADPDHAPLDPTSGHCQPGLPASVADRVTLGPRANRSPEVQASYRKFGGVLVVVDWDRDWCGAFLHQKAPGEEGAPAPFRLASTSASALRREG